MNKLITLLNNVFRRPGVGGRESAVAYSEWEYRWGRELIGEYLEPRGDVSGKRILDIGCGLGGKTVAYGESGAAEVYGTDISLDHTLASEEFASREGRSFQWGFFSGDASALPVPSGMFDTVVANDAMEHFADPEGAVREMARVTKPGGAVWLFFTPHFSPLGSHLYDYVYTPWCHLLFSRESLKRAIRDVLKSQNGEMNDEAIEKKLDAIMLSYDNDLNHMSIRRYRRIVREVPELKVSFEELKPAKFRVLDFATRIPLVRELVTGTVVCRLERVDG